MLFDQAAAKAPSAMYAMPTAQPFNARTYGSDKTPAPIAEEQRAKMLPRIEPAPIFEKVRSLNVRLMWALGDIKSSVFAVLNPYAG